MRSILAFINFVPLSPGGTCVFMRHTEAYKRWAISDTIKMCISQRCFKRNPRPLTPPGSVSARSPISRTRYFISLPRRTQLWFYLPEEIIMQPHRLPAILRAAPRRASPINFGSLRFARLSRGTTRATLIRGMENAISLHA